MMSRTEILRGSREGKAVKFLEFMKLYARNCKDLCCFFEGDDAKYYCIRIATILPNRSWSPINCRGKEQVMELYTLISGHSEYSNASVAFFVDRDFDQPLKANLREKVYETPCYSIENLYTSPNCFSQIIKSEFGITDGNYDGNALQTCCDLFQTTQRLFHDTITELNAWIWLQRNVYKDGGGVLRLNEVKLDRFAAVGLGAVTKLYSTAELTEIFSSAPEVDNTLLAEKTAEFQKCDRRNHFRGKYEIEFLRLMLVKLMEDFCSKIPCHFPSRGTVKCTLSKANIISELSQYADTPDCLRNIFFR